MLLVAWESTGACNLSCSYCRASAGPAPSGDELSTGEIKGLIKEIAPMGAMLIISGGEPLLRQDVFEVARYAAGSGVRVSLASNGTLITPEIVDRILLSGISRVSISLDGASAKTNDATRGEGSFDLALRGIRALSGRVEFQINMTITPANIDELDPILDLAEREGAAAAHIFFMVPTGRGRAVECISPEMQRSLLERIASEERSIEIRPTCAPQYGRVLMEKKGSQARTAGGCIAGIRFVFISRTGDVFPCGYFPLSAGSIRDRSFSEIWSSSPLLNDLRERRLKGRCGSCNYVRICGGCRARAYALTGDYLGEDPTCAWRGSIG
ncbi:radical SAM/SPASM domain-containing protein [Methanothrix thermoacetophila]|uniref:Radical SAM domain protein n=1 Tax=Methanothrix thermoacetophila (strain DSM 6194 / JCM 14653 / NBRC 101360 / PT) TaxID=349307 RepID=A0B894_METTP|nr:radical SAM protein [Methanothrix thermoacetophila]ABK14918.1 Radical SAM domain protein [Methanothrix thermoacetophila PT]